MRNLAYYKGAVIRWQQALKTAKTREFREEIRNAIRFASQRVRQIEESLNIGA